MIALAILLLFLGGTSAIGEYSVSVEGKPLLLTEDVNITEFDLDHNRPAFRHLFKPFIRTIGPIHHFMTVRIIGTFTKDADKIMIEFKQSRLQYITLLDIEVRFQEGKVVVNHKNKEGWHLEQRKEDYHKNEFPYYFDLRLQFVSDETLRVFTNRVHTGYFNIPNDKAAYFADQVWVHGHLESLVHFDYGGRYMAPPNPVALRMDVNDVFETAAFAFKKLPIAFQFRNAKGQCLLIISIRYDENVIVRNSQDAQGNWLNEERAGGMPVQMLRVFDLTVISLPDDFQIYFDGKMFVNFRKRSHDVVEELQLDGYMELMTAYTYVYGTSNVTELLPPKPQ